MTFKSRMQKRIEALMSMVKDGNLKFQDALDRMKGVEQEEKLKPTRRSTTTPGYASKHHKAIPNPERRNCKPLMAGWPHRSEPRGYDFGHKRVAPHIDEVRALEQKHGIKIHVRDGIMYGRHSSLPISDFLANEQAEQHCCCD